MSDQLPPCPECSSEYVYEMGALLVCPECAHEWAPGESGESEAAARGVVKDSVGNQLSDGDTVTIVKDMKVKGAPKPIKVGTKARNIRIIEPVNGHDIDAKVEGFGPMLLKSSIVKKML